MLLLPCLASPAQGLPELPRATEINTGVLQNGADYYLVKNGTEAGHADFALVRQSSSDGGELREALDSLPHFTDSSPCGFLSRHGIGYGAGGYVSVDGFFETLRLSHVPVYNHQVRDSTLLLLFDIMSLSTTPQAVVISGDIDVDVIKERSNLLSLMASSLPGKEKTEGDTLVKHDIIRFVSLRNGSSNTAVIKLIYSTERTSPENMNTVIPYVTSMYAKELGAILEDRIRSSFRTEGIPVSGIRFSYKDSSQDFEDERYSLSLSVPADRTDASLRLTGSVLGTLDREGVSMAELVTARNKEMAAKTVMSGRMTNSEYVDKCLRSYKYGSDLALEREVIPNLFRREVHAENELQLFNGFVSALLDPENNLVLRVDAPDSENDGISALASFRLGWTMDGGKGRKTERIQDVAPSPRIRLKKETAEPISGGTMWTFSNGMRVIFKNIDTPGEFEYAYIVNGGYPSIRGIGAGEAPFADDMFSLCRINGMGGDDFNNALVSRGISMKAEVSMSSFRLSGSARSGQLREVFNALRAMSSNVEISREDFNYYALCEALEEDSRSLFPRDFIAISDSVLSPGYMYHERKFLKNLGGDFNVRAAEYFGRQLSRFGEGVLVLAGDLEPEHLEKALPGLLGNFKTTGGDISRPRVSYPMISGKATRIVEASGGIVGGKELGVSICLSTRQPYNNEELMTFRVAIQIIRRELIRALSGCGYYVELSSREDNYPRGTFSVYACCRPCRRDGLPKGIEVKDQLAVLSALRATMANLPSVAISNEELKACKALLAGEMAAAENDAETVFDRVEARFCEGKDLVSGAKAALDAVTEDDVRKMLASLNSWAGVENIIL